MTDTNPRDLIQSLSDALDNAIRVIEREDGTQHIDTARPVLAEARAYLSQPEPESPTLDEIDDLCAEHSFCYEDSESLECLLLIITDALARWGK